MTSTPTNPATLTSGLLTMPTQTTTGQAESNKHRDMLVSSLTKAMRSQAAAGAPTNAQIVEIFSRFVPAFAELAQSGKVTSDQIIESMKVWLDQQTKKIESEGGKISLDAEARVYYPNAVSESPSTTSTSTPAPTVQTTQPWSTVPQTTSAVQTAQKTDTTTATTTSKKNTPADQSMRKSIQDLVASIDPSVKMETEVEDLLMTVADQFVESVTSFSSRLARHRGSEILEIKDLQLHLERNHNIRVPGFATEDTRPLPSQQGVPSANSALAALAKKPGGVAQGPTRRSNRLAQVQNAKRDAR